MKTDSRIGLRNSAKRLANASPGPWHEWRTHSRHARAIRFIEAYCRAPKGRGWGEPIKLARFQKEWLEEALADGISVAILQTPRGNGKSTFGGAVATWALFDDDETGAPQVPIIATTISQAIRSCYGVALAMVKAEPELVSRTLIYTGIATPRIHVPYNDGELFPVSNDPNGLQGLDPSLGIVDEIGFQPIESWNSLQLAQGKRARSVVFGLGTPGLDRNNALWNLRSLVTEGATLPGTVFHEYSAPEDAAIDDVAAWRQANPALRAGFLQLAALRNDRARTQEGPFRVFRLGQWHQGVDSWLGADGARIWENLVSPYDLRPTVPTYLGVDIGLKRDASAVVMAQHRPDGRVHAVAKVWAPAPDRPVDVTDVMQFIRDACATYRVDAVSFDPRFFDVPAKMLTDEGFPMVETPQALERMTPAYVSLYEAIMGAKITHDGDKVFTTHVLNGVPRFSERGFILEKGKSRGKIDAAVALALAYDQVLRHETEEPSVYGARELVAV